MSKPTILTVDDDPQVSAAIARDLARQYGADYRIVRASSGPEALAALTKLALRDEPVALIAADQRMPRMTGIEMLQQSRAHAPAAKLLLLTAYADTDVAIKAINDIGLDYYLLKPWDPPGEGCTPSLTIYLATGGRPIGTLGLTSGWSGIDGPTVAMRSRRSWRATMCRTAGTTSSATPRPSGCAA